MVSTRPLLLPALLLLTDASAPAAVTALLGGGGDHSLCCGPRGRASVDGMPSYSHRSFPNLVPTVATTSVTSTAASAGATPASTAPSAPSAPAAAPAAASAPAPQGGPELVNGYLKLGFDRLASFPFNPAPYDPAKPDVPPPSSADQIPASIKSYDGKKAIVSGFMLPVKTEKGLVTEFLLMRDAMMCCYGVVPNINEWVVVRMTNGGVQAMQDIPLAVHGTLRVKEMFESGYLSGIYMLEGEKMNTAKL
jgi:hypothetical protein